MCIDLKLYVCGANMAYFIKNGKSLMTYFKNEEKTPWKHQFDRKCYYCNAYFLRMEFSV